MSGIESLSPAAYTASRTSSSSRATKNTEPSEPIFVFDESQRKDDTARNVGIAAVGAAALAFLFRGKIKNIPFVKNTVTPAIGKATGYIKGFWSNKVKPTIKKVGNWAKKLFKKPNTKLTKVDTPIDVTDIPKSTFIKSTRTEKLKGIDIKHVRNSHKRNMVQNALDDLPTDADILAAHKLNKYQPPTSELAQAIKANNATANKASALSRQIQNNVDDASLAALRRARENLNTIA